MKERHGLLGCLVATLISHMAAAEVPTTERLDSNLAANPKFDGMAGWNLLNDTYYDPETSRTADGSGSIVLTTPHGEPNASLLEAKLSAIIEVEPGKTYTFAAYVKSEGWPSYVAPFLTRYAQLPSPIAIDNTDGSRYGTTKDDAWEEVVLTYRAEPGDGFVRPKFVKRANTQGAGKIWIDDVYFGEGMRIEQPAAEKTPFVGDKVRVDKLGNFEVRRAGQWTAWFPLCVYSDGTRDKSVYSTQGFNCDIRLASSREVSRAAEAVSEFNPDGLMAGFDISAFIDTESSAYGDTNKLTALVSDVLNSDAADNLLMFHWDFENDYDRWDTAGKVIDAVKSVDRSQTGGRARPIYALNGNFGLARSQAASALVDVTGTYFWSSADDDSRPAGNTGTSDLEIMRRLEGQTIPVTFAQFNEVNGAGALRRRLYQAIIEGAKGIGLWRDCFDPSCQSRFSPDVARPLDEHAWWPDLPQLRSEVEQLLPLIREPEAATWKLRMTNPKLAYRLVEHDGDGHVILVNLGRAPQIADFTIVESPYTAQHVTNFFTGRSVADVHRGRFEVAIPGNGVGTGTAVLRVSAR